MIYRINKTIHQKMAKKKIMDEITLETERLLLRWFRESDLADYLEIVADPEVMYFIAIGGRPMTELEAWRHMAFTMGHWYFLGYGSCGGILKSSRRFGQGCRRRTGHRHDEVSTTCVSGWDLHSTTTDR